MVAVIRRYPPVSAEIEQEILQLRKDGYAWGTVADKVGITHYHILALFDPAQLEIQRARLSDYKKKPKRHKRSIRFKNIYAHPGPRVHAPSHIIEERDRVYAETATPNVLLLGDPRPGRSALDRWQAKQENSPSIRIGRSDTINTLSLFTRMGARN